MLKEAINTFEELKKYVFIINRGNKQSIIIKFENENFYHLIGLHKTKITSFLPNKIMSKDKIYKYLKANVDQYEAILNNLIKEQKRLELRIESFPYILDLLNENNTVLFNLKYNMPKGSLYKGDYGLFKIFEDIYCLLGLKVNDISNDIINCMPQSWMPNNRKNSIIEFKTPIFMKEIIKVPVNLYSKLNIENLD